MNDRIINVTDEFIAHLNLAVEAGKNAPSVLAYHRNKYVGPRASSTLSEADAARFLAQIKEIDSAHKARMEKAVATPHQDRVESFRALRELTAFGGRVQSHRWQNSGVIATIDTPQGTQDVVCKPNHYACPKTGTVVARIAYGELVFGPEKTAEPTIHAEAPKKAGPGLLGGLQPLPA